MPFNICNLIFIDFFVFLASTARHQSDGNVNVRGRAKKLQAGRRSVDTNKNSNSAKNLAAAKVSTSISKQIRQIRLEKTLNSLPTTIL